ncbi:MULTISPECIES: hypothetical protein [Myxococcus]|uniref:hypothetical protein n=1 Tax=Myxococcus TaxID=32 RepID=UPI0011433908|nr:MULTISPECIES: hypothetical protein [Myxococcus]NOK00098.1 hypothetical protein [Myxococcus xanthus]
MFAAYPGQPAGLLRNELLEKLQKTRAVVSVHEHIGVEHLVHASGRRVEYRQSLSQWAELCSTIHWGDLLPGAKLFAAAVFAMPIYESSRGRRLDAEGGRDGDIYWTRNRFIVAACGAHQTRPLHDIDDGKSQSLPLPVLFVDPSQSAKDFERAYEDMLPFICGLKWHPYAQGASIATFIQQGYLDLAASRGLPTVVHCARPGMQDDFGELFNALFVATRRSRAVVDVAHAGFLHDNIHRIQENEYLYLDCGPWSMICDHAMPGTGPSERAVRLARILETLPQAFLFAMDTPWNLITWIDGTLHGAEVARDVGIVRSALASLEPSLHEQWLHKNPLQFLHGRPWRAP